ncbi:MAG: tRNA preQ1(34) S-adenosylmethionine ribosyltransferase-isomerase QueA [Betaproteobacteria bacterium]|nr:tRNA preQ1(34) S-adenosylmethionine ribosyltransferase-isomerase QueA [Betaproteobacteria bacterium]
MPQKSLTLADFDYVLPPQLIAQFPLPARSASRLLMVENDRFEDRHIPDLAQLLLPGDLLVMNDTRVLHARLRGVKSSGGEIEVLVERVIADHQVLAQIRASKPPRAGMTLRLENAFDATVAAREGEFYRLEFPGHIPAISLLERYGRLPLPPYIERDAAATDETRYQTVYAREPGSVAAPTAGLHFDAELLEALQARGCRVAYVTLHVGAGTFQPVRNDNLAEHRMHREQYFLPPDTVRAIEETQAQGGKIVAVGTTTLRTLESAALSAANGKLRAAAGETDLFILPGFNFRIVDRLLTNFHLPKSTLLMLVSAFAGPENIRRAYAHAIAQAYRFFSYGDAMLLTRNHDRREWSVP